MYPLVFQTDFGLVDGAVSAMYGVAYSVNPELKMHDLTHEITPYSVWEASYRLIQTVAYWPNNTVFVSVVDPRGGFRPEKRGGEDRFREIHCHPGQRNADPYPPAGRRGSRPGD